MKCLLVVNKINDVFFADFDDDFSVYINREAAQSGLLEPEEAEKNLYTIDSSTFMQLFSPLVLANWALIAETKNPCTSVTLENGHIFVFKQVDDLLYICMNGDGRESESALDRKILIFQKFVGFLFGPISEEIGHSRFEDKKARWNFLRRLLGTYSSLANEEQSFLVEAIERLHVNQVVNEKCIELLEAVMKTTHDVLDTPPQHSLLLVNSKLLALYSDRMASELQAVDILNIILLIQDIFPPNETLEDLFSYSCSMASSSQGHSRSFIPSTARQLAAHNCESSDQEYHSAVTSPSGERSQTPSTEADTPLSVGRETSQDVDTQDPQTDGQTDRQTDRQTPEESVDLEHGQTSQEHGQTSQEHGQTSQEHGQTSQEHGQTSQDLEHGFTDRQTPEDGQTSHDSVDIEHGQTDGQDTTDGSEEQDPVTTYPDLSAPEGEKLFPTRVDFQARSASYTESPNPSPCPDRRTPAEEPSTKHTRPIRTPLGTDYWRQMVFLRTPICTFFPHQLHCTEVLPGIVLVTVIEAQHCQIAPYLCQMFQFIKDLLSGQKNKLSRARGQMLYDFMNSLLVKIQGTLKKVRGNIERVMKDVKRKWDNEGLKTNLLEYLEQDAGVEVSTGLEMSLSELMKKLKELFSHLYLSPQLVDERLKVAMRRLQHRMKIELQDYKNYLSVKAQRNIPMTSYLDEFPGLVHFIYIDRQSNQMTAPSLNITAEETGTLLLKQKVWFMVDSMQVKLSQGYTTVMFREGDFYFSYFLWFEDNTGRPLSVQQPFKPTTDMPPPGILTGLFYRKLLQKCFPNTVPGTVHCYELFLLHVGLAHPQYIVGHCRQLARKLWELSGEAYTPISLL